MMKKTGIILACLGLVLLTWMSVAQADLDIIPNPSFETNNGLTAAQLAGPLVTLAPGSTNITDWVVVGNPVDYVGPTMWKNYLDYSVHLKNLGAIQTTLNTVVGGTYVLEFDIAGNWEGGSDTKHLRVSATGNPSQDFERTKPVWWDSALYPPDQWEEVKKGPGWEDVIYTFIATSTQTVLTFASLEINDFGPAIDDTKIEKFIPPVGPSQVPLPGAAVLFGSGLVGLAGWMRFRKS